MATFGIFEAKQNDTIFLTVDSKEYGTVSLTLSLPNHLGDPTPKGINDMQHFYTMALHTEAGEIANSDSQERPYGICRFTCTPCFIESVPLECSRQASELFDEEGRYSLNKILKFLEDILQEEYGISS